MALQKCARVFGAVLLVSISVALVCSDPAEDGKKSYRNYKVIRTQPLANRTIISKLLSFVRLEDVSFWKYPALNQSADIMTSLAMFASVANSLTELGVEHRTIVEDVEKLFENQNNHVALKEAQAPTLNSFWYRYHGHGVIINYAKQMASRYRGVSYEAIGKSTEGRELGLVKISSGGNKSAIFIDGGMHGREWISPATVTYVMHNLITNRNYTDLIDKFDWYIVPLVNPDGYEYSYYHDRMWRKTRRPNSGSPCRGTDPNRNWGFKWGGEGASDDPCDETYKGTHAFSEPETKAVANAILARRNKIKMYLTFHSYSQLWLLPWGYSSYEVPADYEDLFTLAVTGAKAMSNTYKTWAGVGSGSQLMYESSGSSQDWAKGHAGIKYSYAIELRDTGHFGFALPASHIHQSGEETLNGVAALARSLYERLGNQTVG